MTSALLLSWDWRLDVTLVLGLAATLYLLGWRRLSRAVSQREAVGRSNPHPPLLARWKPVAYLSGLLLIAIALMSPIDVLASQLFFMHMIQHLLIMMVAAPLLWIAGPFAMIVWGLPRRARQTVSSVLNGRSLARQILAKATSPGVVWLLFFAVYVGWHDPRMYNLSLRSGFVHDLQHLSFFLVAMLVWWHITGAAPRFHRTLSTGQRLAFVVSLVPIGMLTGIAISFAQQPIYEYYTTVPRIYGISVIDDQVIAGVIMWIPGSMMFLLAGLILLGRIVQREAAKPVDPNPPWLVDDSAAARRI